jgi:uncharacterized protein
MLMALSKDRAPETAAPDASTFLKSLATAWRTGEVRPTHRQEAKPWPRGRMTKDRSQPLSSRLMLECVHSIAMKGFHCKRSIAFWLLLAEFLFIPVRTVLAEAANSLPKPTDYVNDYAHVLSLEGATRLDRICMELNHSQANAQFAIVTIHTLEGDDAADYASQLEDRWKIGRKGSDRGVLVLLAVDDHKWRIDVGYGLEGILNDAKIGDIGRSMVPYLRAKDYDSALESAVGQLAQVIAADAKVTLAEEPVSPPPVRHTSPKGLPVRRSRQF